MADQTSAANLPYGSVVVDDVVGVAFYAVEELGISERWHESDTPRGNATVDHAIRKRDAQIVRVGTEAAVAPDARERLARHLYLDRARGDWQTRAAAGWDSNDERINKDTWRRKADAILAVITGQEN